MPFKRKRLTIRGFLEEQLAAPHPRVRVGRPSGRVEFDADKGIDLRAENAWGISTGSRRVVPRGCRRTIAIA
jgi:hypothetical protein